jgi:putative membrane protein
MKISLTGIMGILLATGLGGVAEAGSASSADQIFIAKVSQGGMFEVALGQLAATQGSTQDIRDQGATEAHDHMGVGAKLKSIAGGDGITFPASLNAKFEAELDQAKAVQGTSFDRLYLKDMIVIHNADGAAFAKEAQDGGDPKLRAFAAETHRIVERHLGELKALPAA